MAERTVTEAELVEVVRQLLELLPEDMTDLRGSDSPLTDRWPELAQYVHPRFEAEMIGPFGFAQARQGLEGMAEGWRDFLEPFEAFRIRYNELVPVPSGALLLVEQHGRVRGSDADVTTSSALLWRFRDGLIARAEFYLDADEARQAAGL
jgi:hypothetical protein